MAVVHEVPLIGLCDGAIVDRKRYPSSYLTNKIGDLPDLLPVISWQHPNCDLCGAALAHVTQVYCPLEASPYHRTLHVFVCTSAACCGKSDSWKVLRSQCLESDIKVSPAPPSSCHIPGKEAPMTATDWCDGADDWGMEDWGDPSDTTQAKTQVQSAAQPETAMCTATELDVSDRFQGLGLGEGQQTHSVPTFCPFYISVVDESDLVAQSGLDHAQKLLKEYEKREGMSVTELDRCEGEGGGGEDEKYEKTKARHGDAVFFRFMKKISLCPEQVLRYCWNGSPIFISEPPSNLAQRIPGCSLCGSPRAFELQLMPALVSLLRSKDSRLEMAVEFGTVLVYTCRNSCWTSGWTSPVDEFLFIQADPDQILFK